MDDYCPGRLQTVSQSEGGHCIGIDVYQERMAIDSNTLRSIALDIYRVGILVV